MTINQMLKRKTFINKRNMQIKMNNQGTEHYILNIRKNIYQNQENPKNEQPGNDWFGVGKQYN